MASSRNPPLIPSPPANTVSPTQIPTIKWPCLLPSLAGLFFSPTLPGPLQLADPPLHTPGRTLLSQLPYQVQLLDILLMAVAPLASGILPKPTPSFQVRIRPCACLHMEAPR